MFLKRQFVVMVVSDAQAKLRRFQVRGGQLVGGFLISGLVVLLAVSTPLIALWAHGVSRHLAEVQAERDQLAEKTTQADATLQALRDQLGNFERRTDQLAKVAGIGGSLSTTRGLGGPAPDYRELAPARRADVLNGQAGDLFDRTAVLDRRLDLVHQALTVRADRLARTPSIYPVQGLINGGFGWRRDPFSGLQEFHTGVDIGAAVGSPVAAPADGIVVQAAQEAGYGNVLSISHGDGVVTRYGHLSSFRARPGEKVHRGQVVGLVGNTGRSTGPHLHYEVLLRNSHVDPMKFLGEDDTAR